MEGKIDLLPLLLAILLPCSPAFAQQDVIDDIETLIKAGKIAEAENLTNRYLVDDPVNTDLLMMKGNVLLNQYIHEQQAQLSLRPNYDQSIYNMTTLEKGPHPVTLDEKTSNRVAKLWRAAATLDPAREDMHLGLCQVYAISEKREELLAYLPIVKAHIVDQEDLHYRMVAYAYNLQERGDQEGSLLAMKKIHSLFPEQTGLLSDIGAGHFFAGQLDSARHYFHRSFSNANGDENILGNVFFFCALMGEYDTALEAIRQLPGSGYLLYEGVLDFYRNEKKWQKPIEKFLKESHDSTEAKAAEILTAKDFSMNMDTYLQLIELDLGDPVKLLLHLKFMETGEFLPAFNAAETYAFNKHYPAAVSQFNAIGNAGYPLDAADEELFHFYYAWALIENGQKDAALPIWEQLLSATDFYKKSAAHWFVGKYYFDNGDKSKGREYFAKMATDPSASKYATMCWDFMGG